MFAYPCRDFLRTGLLSVVVLCAAPALQAQVFLTADGHTDSYALVNSALGAGPETPDCSHPDFGEHITQASDSELGKFAFVFNIHVTPDNDRCTNFDRQRLEIKTDGGSPAYVKGFLNDSVSYRWKFKLPAGFQPSPNFTHIHQIKAGDGDSGAPIITLTPRAGSPDSLQIIATDSNGTGATLFQTDLAPFVGVWVEAFEQITYSHTGKYSVVIKTLEGGTTLLSYSNGNIDLWRTGTTFSRPKWGIYRSLNSPSFLRDEQVRFDRFCIAKGSDVCPSEVRTGNGAVTLLPTADTYVRDGTTSGQNFGTAAVLAVKANPQVGLNRHIFLKFDLSSLTSASTAKLRLFGNFTAASGTSPVTVHAEDTDSWTEPGLTWDNQPAAGSTLVTVPVGRSAQYWEWNLTTFVQNQIATGQHIMSLELQNDATTSDPANFNSREAASNRPQLVVQP
ncbi:MAG: DNRLRE domain-containing protein [Steroidobacteraceae bacterium]